MQSVFNHRKLQHTHSFVCLFVCLFESYYIFSFTCYTNGNGNGKLVMLLLISVVVLGWLVHLVVLPNYLCEYVCLMYSCKNKQTRPCMLLLLAIATCSLQFCSVLSPCHLCFCFLSSNLLYLIIIYA
jgi:hypothetical protein